MGFYGMLTCTVPGDRFHVIMSLYLFYRKKSYLNVINLTLKFNRESVYIIQNKQWRIQSFFWHTSIHRYTHSTLLKLTLRKTLFRRWLSKNSYIQIKKNMAISLWELQTNLTLKDEASSTEESHKAV